MPPNPSIERTRSGSAGRRFILSETESATRLAEISERLKSLGDQVAALSAEQAAAFGTYAASDKVYREELKRYGNERSSSAMVKAAQMVFRPLALVLLAYIAYRVSR